MLTATMHQNAISVFLAYAYEDEPLLRQLEKHLSGLQRQRLISAWHDRKIVPGTSWAEEIDTQLEHASIILLLVSADFLASDYCYQIEMQRALERHAAGEARVIPIILRPSDWQHTPFAHLQALPTDARAITEWRNRDRAWIDVATGIRRAIEDLPLLAASASRAELPAIWNIPYPRNPFFTGRDELLAQLYTQLRTGQTTALSQSPHALSGLGGIGKTQLATEYAYRYHRDYKAVLWARAESEETLNASYTEIAKLLTLPERNAKEQEIVIQGVKMWLQTHRHWLLILDNADHLDLLSPFLPPTPGGHILFTTRAWAMKGLARRLEVEILTDEQGVLLLLRRAGRLDPDKELAQASSDERQWAARLVQELGGLPLALDQAGAYLEATGVSLEEYYHIYEHHRPALLSERGSLMPDHPDAVVKTLSLSFQRVEAKNAVTAELLRCCAYLASDAIPEEIFIQGAKHLGPLLAPVAADTFLFAQAIEALRAYSLVGRDPHTRTLTLHRLVQAVVQETLSSEEQQIWATRAMLAVHAMFPPVLRKYEQWLQFGALIAHTLCVIHHIEQFQVESLEAGHVLYMTAWYLKEYANYSQAEQLYQKALFLQQKALGKEHVEVARTLNGLGRLYCAQERYEEAREHCEHALYLFEHCLAPDHFEVSFPLDNLGYLYAVQGQYAKAEQFLKRALAIREARVGQEEYYLVARILTSLGKLYRNRGNFVEAERLYQRVLSLREKYLRTDDPEVAEILYEMARLKEMQGKKEEAKNGYIRALEIREQVLGSTHPETTKTRQELRALLHTMGG